MMANILNWYEIPASDFQRAVKFYETILGVAVNSQELNGMKIGYLPQDADAVGGAIMSGPGQIPSATGVTVYFKGGEDLALPLSRVVSAGGKILMPKTLIAKHIGHIALFKDTEGNRIGLHSMN
jgi:uncharacterized protein